MGANVFWGSFGGYPGFDLGLFSKNQRTLNNHEGFGLVSNMNLWSSGGIRNAVLGYFYLTFGSIFRWTLTNE